MALAGALCDHRLAVTGITNKSLRALMTGLLGVAYTIDQTSYDLRRLRLNGPHRPPRPHQHATSSPPTGSAVAVFYTKVHDRLLRPLLAADRPPAPLPVRQALRTLDRAVDDYIANARMAA